MTALQVEVGYRIRELRKVQGWSQTQLAAKAQGLNYRYIGALERGEVNASFRTIEKIAAALEVRAYQLFLFTEAERAKDHAVSEELIQELLTSANEEVKEVLVRILKEVVDLGR